MMKSKKLVSAILAVASIAGGVVGAQAETLEQKVDSYTSRVQQAEKDIKALDNKVNAIDTTGIANNKAEIEANKTAIATQGSQISQIQQDMAQDAMDRANEMSDLTAKVNQKADKGDVEQNKNDIASNAAAIQTETQKREEAVKGLQDKLTVANGQIENEKTTRENAVNDLQNQVTANKTATENNATAIQQETTDRQSAVESLKQQIAAEKNDRIYADKAQDKVIETVNKNMADGFNAINTNVADGFTALNNTDAALQGQITANKGDIADLQHKIVASGQAFNAEQVDQIKTNKDDIGTIFGQLDQGAYNTADGYVVKKEDTIGGALKNLDKNAADQQTQISQIQQDMAQDAIDRADEVNGLKTQINQKADKSDVEQNKNDIASNAAAIQTETQKREEAVKGLQEKLTVANGQIENEKTTRENAVNDLQSQVTANKTATENNATAIQKETTDRKEEDTKLKNNIDNETAARIAGDNALNSRIDQVESDANKGIAKASALAALRPLEYDPDNKFDISAAGGFYKGENAFALGAFYRPNRNVMLSMGTTLTSGDNAYNVGLTFKIGKSGKHTEASLTTADLYAMIGAMQDKMDQQQKKIEELEAKQAK